MTHETIAVEMKIQHHFALDKLLPFLLTICVFALDQCTKYLIIKNIPLYTIGISFFGDLIRIIHVCNPGIAFSIGDTLSETIRRILFSALPLIVIIIVIVIYFRNNELTRLQRWANRADSSVSTIGGGLGNLFDRFFRPEGVVDFIDVKFFGIFGWNRFPTFNVADSSVVICGIIILLSFFVSISNSSNSKHTVHGSKTHGN